jgi:hypothetical protein
MGNCGFGKCNRDQKMNKLLKEKGKEIINLEINDYSTKSFSEISKMQFPINKKYTIDQKVYQIKIVMLENTENYIHLSIEVDDGGFSAFLPLSDSFLIYKDGRMK